MRTVYLAIILLLTGGALAFAQNTGYNPQYSGSGSGCKAGGTCYYIDFANGSDSNTGLSKTAAWKTAPGMACATGNAASHSVGQTDELIFKGGVTWPASCFPWTIGSGSAGSPNSYAYPGVYVGYDPTWNSGTVVGVHVVDPGSCSGGTTLSVALNGGGGSGATATAQLEADQWALGDLEFVTVTSAGSGYTSNPTVAFSISSGGCKSLPTAYADINSPVMSGSGAVFGTASSILPMFTFTPNYGTLDHIEFAHYLFYAGSTYSGGSPVVIYAPGSRQELRNLFVHDFGMAGAANNTLLQGARNAAQTSGLYGSSAGSGSLLTNSIFNNFEIESHGCDNGGLATRCVQQTGVYDMPAVTNSVINGWRGGLYTQASATSGYLVAGNKMWAILCDAGFQHPDAFYLLGGTIAYNNILRDIFNGTAAFYVETNDGSSPSAKGMTSYLFNNVVFGIGNNGSGTSTPPIGWSAEFTSGSATSLNPAPDLRAYNNTFYSNSGNTNCMNSGQWYGASIALQSSYRFTLANNHCISDQSQGHWYANNIGSYGLWNGLTNPNLGSTQAAIDGTAVVQSPTATANQGYAASNSYAPTSSSGATVAFANTSGSANLTSLCSTSVAGISLAPLCSDINGTPRPTTGGWQAGAYYLPTSGGGGVSVVPPPSVATNVR